MSNNILILNGDPLFAGQASALAKELAKGASAVDKKITEFYLEGCIYDSYICENTDERVNPNIPSSQYDDIARIYAAYKEADAVVFVSPQYNWNISSQLLSAVDRLFSVAHNDPDYEPGNKQFVLLMTAEGSDFSAVKGWYDSLTEHLHLKNAGAIFCGGLKADEDITQRPEFQRAFDLGQEL